jgi:hypothetical protein
MPYVTDLSHLLFGLIQEEGPKGGRSIGYEWIEGQGCQPRKEAAI